MIDSHGGYTLVVFFPISDLLKQYQQSEGNNLGAPDGEANLHNPEFYLNLFPPDWRDVHLLASAFRGGAKQDVNFHSCRQSHDAMRNAEGKNEEPLRSSAQSNLPSTQQKPASQP